MLHYILYMLVYILFKKAASTGAKKSDTLLLWIDI